MDDLLMHGDEAEYRWTLVGTNTEWSIGGDSLIASSLGRYDQAEYERRHDQGVEEPYGL